MTAKTVNERQDKFRKGQHKLGRKLWPVYVNEKEKVRLKSILSEMRRDKTATH